MTPDLSELVRTIPNLIRTGKIAEINADKVRGVLDSGITDEMFLEMERLIDVVDFSIAIGISSWEYTEAENHLKVWECLKNPQFGLSREITYPTDVVRAPLSFLLLNGTPPVERLTWKSGLTDFAKVAETVLQDFMAYGEAFLAPIDSPLLLIRFLQHMDAKKGVTSVNASLAAAIYLFHLGEKDAALVELKDGFDAAIRKAQARNHDAEAIQALNCKYERYRNYWL